MQNKTIKLTIISFLTLFSMFFINIDGVKADIPHCDTSTKYEKVVSCDYPNKGLFMTQLDLKVYFAKTTSGKYCAEIKNIELISWFDFNNSDAATDVGTVAFDLKNSTFNKTLENNECPSLKFVNDYDQETTKTVKFTVSDKGLGNAITTVGSSIACKSTGIVSFGSECWILPGENFSEVSSDEMQNTVKANTAARDGNNIDYIYWWGKNTEEGDYTYTDVGSDCNSLSSIITMLHQILWIVNIVAIIILIIMTAVDFVRVITGSEEDNMKKAFSNLIKRAVTIIILLLLPIILGMVINILNKEGTIQIGDDGEPFCEISN